MGTREKRHVTVRQLFVCALCIDRWIILTVVSTTVANIYKENVLPPPSCPLSSFQSDYWETLTTRATLLQSSIFHGLGYLERSAN